MQLFNYAIMQLCNYAIIKCENVKKAGSFDLAEMVTSQLDPFEIMVFDWLKD